MATTPLPFPQEAPGSVGPAAPLPSGTVVAHLTIARVLHEGLHNVVYLAHDPSGQPMALMEYFPRALALRQPDGSLRARQAGDAIAMSVGREAFVIEANTLERIDCPGIVHVLGSLQAHRTVYRAMRFIDGPTLERHLSVHGGAPSVGAVVRLLDHLLDALDALHRAGVVHGCVRPDQILMSADDRPVLLGMGSAGAELSGHEAGPWTAPEQAAMSRHDRINSATDLYMAAATAWCYATGGAPPTLRERLADPDAWSPALGLADLPEEAPGDGPGAREHLIAALTAALTLLPSERPQRVEALRRLLRPTAAFAAAPAAGEPDGTVPLWVGAMPDRDEQWEVFEREHAIGRRPPTDAAPSRPPTSEMVTDLPLRRASHDARRPSAPASRRWWWQVPAVVLAALAAAGGWLLWREGQAPAVTVSARPALPAIEAAVDAPPVGERAALAPLMPGAVAVPALENPAASAAAPARVAASASGPTGATQVPARTAPAPTSPRAACGTRTQFALLYCLQEQCRQTAWRDHAQCNELRRRGDIQ